MSDLAFTINMMTASLTPGDAIGNYLLTSARLWQSWGTKVHIYADNISPVYGGLARPTSWYKPNGNSLLWYHYSIFTPNLELALNSHDYKVFDFHGVAPASLFAGQNPHLQSLCEIGRATLPTLADQFDLCVVHSEYSRSELISHGFEMDKIHKLPLIVDTSLLVEKDDDPLAALLSRLEYILFVGRIIPQKDILAMLDIFTHIHAERPDVVLILAGTRHLAKNYQRQIDRAIVQKGLDQRVLMTGQVNDPTTLASLFANAKMLLVTSEWESFCVPVIEAMYFGTPVAVNDIPPLPEVAGNGGIVIEKHRPHDAAKVILNLWRDHDLYQHISHLARKRSASFTDSALTAELLKLLHDTFDPH